MENDNQLCERDYEKEKKELLEIIDKSVSPDIIKRIELANNSLEISQEHMDFVITNIEVTDAE